jgi:hypothetical protein
MASKNLHIGFNSCIPLEKQHLYQDLALAGLAHGDEPYVYLHEQPLSATRTDS